MRRLFAICSLLLLAGIAGAQDLPSGPTATETPPAAQPGESPAAPADCADGMRMFLDKRHDEAIPLLLGCLEQGGDRLDPLLALTIISLQKRQDYDAVKFGRRALALDDGDPDVRYWYGRALLAHGDAQGALAQWEAGLALDTEHLGILEGMGRLLIDMGQDTKAYGLLTQLTRVGGDLAWVYRTLSEVAQRHGMWREALGHWRSALERSDPSGADLRQASELAIIAGDTAYALASAREAVAIDPVGSSFGSLGEALFVAERHVESERALVQAVDLSPDSPRIRFNLANLLEIQGRSEDADPHFARYVQLSPDDPIGHYNYAVHLDKMGRSEAALVQIARAAALDTVNVGIGLLQARLLEKTGDYPAALGVLDRLLEQDPGNAAELERWREALLAAENEMAQGAAEGKVRLLHILLRDPAKVEAVGDGLAAGEDFGDLAVRFSAGPTAHRGGDIGWVDPAGMTEDLRRAIENLGIDEISPPVESGGLTHYFKRVR